MFCADSLFWSTFWLPLKSTTRDTDFQANLATSIRHILTKKKQTKTLTLLTLASIRRITSPGFWKADIKAFNENTACWLMAQSITLSVSSFLFVAVSLKTSPLSPHWLSYLVCYWPVFEVHCARYTLALKWTHTHTLLLSCPRLRVRFDSCPLSEFEWVSKK